MFQDGISRAIDRPDVERKLLIENASVARSLWFLVPYSDTEELRVCAEDAARKGKHKAIFGWFEQTFNSTAGDAPTQKP